MSDLIRCSNCLGAKQVMKLGGMMGSCNLCLGKGMMNRSELVKSVPVTIEDVISKELINAVSDCVPASTVTIKSDIQLPDSDQVVVDSIKIDGKKALYKRKRA